MAGNFVFEFQTLGKASGVGVNGYTGVQEVFSYIIQKNDFMVAYEMVNCICASTILV